MHFIRKVREGSHRKIYIGGLKVFSYRGSKETKKRLFSFLCRLLPVQKKKVLLWSWFGNSWSCNPRYISEYLLRHHPGEYRLVWMLGPDAAVPSEFPPQVRLVRMHSFRWLYELATAGTVVTNTRIPSDFGFQRRRKQRYLQTWHGGMLGLKMVEKDTESTLPAEYVRDAKNDSKQITHFISGCPFFTELVRRAFWYDGPILECGSPRIDFLLNASSSRTELCRKARLEPDCQYLLYAPTFRKGFGFDAYAVDMKRTTEALRLRFGGKWKILFRLHPNVRAQMGEMKLPSCCVDVTMHQDMQELLLISDILLTDYSSTMFEMIYCRKKVMLFACDIEEYISSDRMLYFDIYELPFPLAQNNDELEERILNFNEDEYHSAVQAFMEKVGSFEKGTACKVIAETILGARV